MIGYFDTSAVVPLVVAEPSSARCGQIWQTCVVRVSSVLVIAEAYAALAMALRLGRLTEKEHTSAARLLDRRIDELDLFLVTREIADSAARLAFAHALRGCDAVHAATALALGSDDFVAVCGDRALLAALAALTISTIDTNAPEAADG